MCMCSDLSEHMKNGGNHGVEMYYSIKVFFFISYDLDNSGPVVIPFLGWPIANSATRLHLQSPNYPSMTTTITDTTCRLTSQTDMSVRIVIKDLLNRSDRQGVLFCVLSNGTWHCHNGWNVYFHEELLNAKSSLLMETRVTENFTQGRIWIDFLGNYLYKILTSHVFQRLKSSCITNIADIATKPTIMYFLILSVVTHSKLLTLLQALLKIWYFLIEITKIHTNSNHNCNVYMFGMQSDWFL